MVIRTEMLTKEYNGFRAVESLNLEVATGEIYGFLGPNGAGKTTTILLLLGVIKPTDGKIFLFEEDLDKSGLDVRKRVGVVAEHQSLYPGMTAWEYLNFFGELYEVTDRKKKTLQLLEELNLADVKDKLLSTYSKGMRQKIGFARAFLHDPDLLILDEPITGLDPNGVKQIRDLIVSRNKDRKTIFISSHLLSEVEKLCGKVAIINEGKLLAEEKMEDLKRKIKSDIEVKVELIKSKKEVIEELAGLPFVKDIKEDNNIIWMTVNHDKDYRTQIAEAVSRRGGIILNITVQEMSLEEAFITITSKNIPLLKQAMEMG